MEFLNVIAAAAGGFVFGAIWYTVLSKQWLSVSGVKLTPEGKPAGEFSIVPFVYSAIALILVAGFMRHIFAMSGIDTAGKGLLGGLGIGLFFIAPFTVLNNAYPGRPMKLSVIDGLHAVFACGVIGLILMLF